MIKDDDKISEIEYKKFLKGKSPFNILEGIVAMSLQISVALRDKDTRFSEFKRLQSISDLNYRLETTNNDLKRANEVLKKALTNKELGVMESQNRLNLQSKSMDLKALETEEKLKELEDIRATTMKENHFLLARSQELEEKVENMTIMFGKDRVMDLKIKKLAEIYNRQISKIYQSYKDSISCIVHITDQIYNSSTERCSEAFCGVRWDNLRKLTKFGDEFKARFLDLKNRLDLNAIQDIEQDHSRKKVSQHKNYRSMYAFH